MEMITKESAGVTAFLKALDRIINNVEGVIQNYHPTLNGERFLTDRDQNQPQGFTGIPQSGKNTLSVYRWENSV